MTTLPRDQISTLVLYSSLFIYSSAIQWAIPTIQLPLLCSEVIWAQSQNRLRKKHNSSQFELRNQVKRRECGVESSWKSSHALFPQGGNSEEIRNRSLRETSTFHSVAFIHLKFKTVTPTLWKALTQTKASLDTLFLSRPLCAGKLHS